MSAKKVKQARKLSDAKSRALIVVIIVVILIGGALGYLGYVKRKQATTVPAKVSLQQAPAGIKSIPGVGKTTEQYAQLVEQSNVQRAQQAAKTGTSAVPTLVHPSYQGPANFDVPSSNNNECSVENLRRARQAGVSASELRCANCSAQALLAAGYTPGELAAAGYSAKQLAQGQGRQSAAALRNAGYTAAELQRAGYSCQQLVQAGYDPKEIAQAGYTEAQLKQCLSASQLQAIASTASKSNLPANFPKDCSVASLSAAHKEGISAAKIRSVLGCNAKEFKAGGYSAKQLKDAGFTAGDLKRAGFSAQQLKDAGFTPEELRKAGFNAGQLKDAGFKRNPLAKAGYSSGTLTRAGFPPPAPKVVAQPTTVPSTTQAPVSTTATPKGPPSGASIPSLTTPQSQADMLNALRKQQQKEMSEQQRAALMQQLEQAMLTQANDLVASWAPPSVQQYAQAETSQTGNSSGKGMGSSTQASGPTVKAGSIMFAVLDTGVNSDEQSPILATIVQGKLKGAKLLGKFNRVNKKVVLSFSLISMPSMNRSLSINAVAIDPNTARTALASRVNNHYLLRYGTLFASAFISGLGSAIQQSGSTTTQLSGGSVVTTYQNLNKTQLTLAALGNVGSEYSDKLGDNFDIPPTVYVKSGMGIGVLLMSDFTVPETGVQNQNTQLNGGGAQAVGSSNSANNVQLPTQQYQTASQK